MGHMNMIGADGSFESDLGLMGYMNEIGPKGAKWISVDLLVFSKGVVDLVFGNYSSRHKT